MGYAYRHSSAAADLIFTSATFEGYAEDKDAIKAAMDAVQHHRETVQPIREKTGGSTFKNPEGTSAWKEIDNAGCRGLMIGGAQMSPLHCNFMINTGNATGYDLEYLGETVRSRAAGEFRHSPALGNQAHRALQARPRSAGVPWAIALELAVPADQPRRIKTMFAAILSRPRRILAGAFLRPEFRLFLWSSCRSSEAALVMKSQRIPIGSCHGIKSLIL